jgi:predicted nucleic acid-binding protein
MARSYQRHHDHGADGFCLALRSGNSRTQMRSLITEFSQSEDCRFNRAVARHAAQLRARFNICPADALQVASSLVENATIFITNNRGLSRLEQVIDVVVLDDYITQS